MICSMFDLYEITLVVNIVAGLQIAQGNTRAQTVFPQLMWTYIHTLYDMSNPFGYSNLKKKMIEKPKKWMKEVDNQKKSKQIRAFGLDWQYVDQHLVII